MITVRYGIIGLGGIANRFANALQRIEGASLAAVASRDMNRSQEFALRYHAAKAYDAYADLINDPAVDLVYVALTNHLHYEIVKKCLEQHKAVLCEKPMVTHHHQAQELIELARQNQTFLAEAMWIKCLPAYLKAREWVAKGLIGTVCYIHASFAFHMPFQPESRLFNPELEGGSLFDVGVYPIEFANGILNEAPVVTKGVASRCSTGVDDFVSMSLAYPSGALASLSCGFKSKTNRNAEIYGSQGKIIVYDFIGARTCERFLDQESVETFEDSEEDGFVHEIAHVTDVFRQGKLESDLLTHQDTLACARIFDELMRQF